MHGKKEGLIAQFGNQTQFFFDQLASLIGHALWPAPACAALGQLAQPGGWRLSFRYQLMRVVVAQLAQAKLTARSEPLSFLQQCRRIQLGQRLDAAQMALAVGKQGPTGLVNREVKANGGKCIL